METQVKNDIQKAESWLKQHERLVIIVLVLVFSFFVLDKSLNIVGQWEQHRASVAAAQVVADKAKNDVALAQAKQTLDEYKDLLQESINQNAKLEQGIVARDSVLATQQKKDETLPPSELAQRWQGLVGDSGIQSNTSGFGISDSAARATVSKLEQVPVLESDLADEKSKSANLSADVNKANDLISQGKIVVGGLQLQLRDQDKACKTEVAAVKAAARKGKLKWFGIGFVTGYVSGLITKF